MANWSPRRGSRRYQIGDTVGVPTDPRGYGPMNIWMNPDTLSLADGQSVNGWANSVYPSSTYTNSASWPTLYNRIINGHSVVRFPGSIGNVTNTVQVMRPFTAYVVAAKTSAPSVAQRIVSGLTQNWLIGPYSNYWQVFTGATFIQGPAMVLNQWVFCVVTATLAPATKLWVNGAYYGQHASGIDPQGTGLGAYNTFGEGFNGDLAEVGFYSEALSDTARHQLEAYLSAKFSITSTIA